MIKRRKHRKQLQNVKLSTLYQFGTTLHPCCSTVYETNLCRIYFPELSQRLLIQTKDRKMSAT